MKEKKFYTMAEVKETFFPNETMEELEGELTEEEIEERLKKFMEMARKNSQKADSGKVPG
jgi:hypothetical protein